MKKKESDRVIIPGNIRRGEERESGLVLTYIQCPGRLGVGLLAQPKAPVTSSEPTMGGFMKGDLDHTGDFAIVFFRVLQSNCVELSYHTPVFK